MGFHLAFCENYQIANSKIYPPLVWQLLILIEKILSNKKMIRLHIILYIFFALALLPLGCTHTLNINITEIGNYSQPLIEPLPINVGVYYGNAFSTYKTTQENFFADPSAYSQDIGVTRISKIQLGEANVALFDYILSNAFENLTLVQHFPNESENLKNIELIIEPKLSNYIYSERQVYFEPAAWVRVEYTINFYSPEGLQISTWTISGQSSRNIILHGIELLSGHTYCVELTQLAMREVVAQFFAGFCNQRDIKKLFDEQCNQ